MKRKIWFFVSILVVIILLLLFLNAQVEFHIKKHRSLPYSSKPDWESNPFAVEPKGEFGTGLALADINGDGFKDLVVSSGNDKASQHVTVYYNDKKGHFSKNPNWVSADAGRNALLAVGDLDGNGYLDVVVTQYSGKDGDLSKGGVKIYMNDGPPHYLEKKPAWQVSGFPVFDVALADINRDGKLDLVLSGGTELPGNENFSSVLAGITRHKASHAMDEKNKPFSSQARIFYNRNGTFRKKPDWESKQKLVALRLTVADLNQDGLMDVVFGSAPLSVYLGQPSGQLSTKPSWIAANNDHYAQGIDFATTLHTSFSKHPDKVPSIVAAYNNYAGGGKGRFSLYRFLTPYIISLYPHESYPDWESRQGGWGGGVLLADINNDGNLDLLASRWNIPGRNELKSPLLIYLGNDATFSRAPSWKSSQLAVIEDIAVADLDKKADRIAEDHVVINGLNWSHGQNSQSVIYLSRQNIEDIVQVSKNNVVLKHPDDYVFVPGKNWIAFKKPLVKNDHIAVKYQWSPKLDIVMTTWDPDKGNFIYYHH